MREKNCTRRVEAEHSLGEQVERRGLERLKKDLGSFDAVGDRVRRAVREQDTTLSLLSGDVEALGAVDGVPQSLHVFPVGDQAAVHRVADVQAGSLLFRLFACSIST